VGAVTVRLRFSAVACALHNCVILPVLSSYFSAAVLVFLSFSFGTLVVLFGLRFSKGRQCFVLIFSSTCWRMYALTSQPYKISLPLLPFKYCFFSLADLPRFGGYCYSVRLFFFSSSDANLLKVRRVAAVSCTLPTDLTLDWIDKDQLLHCPCQKTRKNLRLAVFIVSRRPLGLVFTTFTPFTD